MNNDCKHDKVYDCAVLCSYPPQRRWVCRKCGQTGTDTIGEYHDPFEYEKIQKRFAFIKENKK